MNIHITVELRNLYVTRFGLARLTCIAHVRCPDQELSLFQTASEWSIERGVYDELLCPNEISEAKPWCSPLHHILVCGREQQGYAAKILFGYYSLVINSRSVDHSWVGLGLILTYKCMAVHHRKGKRYVYSILL